MPLTCLVASLRAVSAGRMLRCSRPYLLRVATTMGIGLLVLGCEPAQPTQPVAPEPTEPAKPPVDSTSTAPVASVGKAFIWSADRGVREIPVPAGVRSLLPVAINDNGLVAGVVVAADGGYREGFVWSEGGGLRRTGTVSGRSSQTTITGLNAAGTVVGYLMPVAGDFLPSTGADLRALVWTVDRGPTAPAGEPFWPLGINDAGSIVGSDRVGPVRWQRDTGFQRMLRTNAECTAPTAINNNGDVLGWTGNDVNGFGCFPMAWVIWRTTAQGETLEVFSCRDKRLCEQDPVAFNDRGQIALNVGDTAVRMSVTGIIDRLPGGRAAGMNNNGDVVGSTSPWPGSPVLWTGAGERILLPLPQGTTQGRAAAINNRGEIVGWAQ